MPRLFVNGVLGERVVRGQTNHVLYPAGDFDRDDVPEIGWNDVDGEEVDLGGGVGPARGALNCTGVQLAPPVTGGFDLYAQETPSGFDDEVIPAAVAPRLNHAQPMFGGSGHEKQFSPFSAQFEAAAGGPTFFEH